MSGRDCDLAIVGGGLAGGLIALAVARMRPELTLRLIEAAATLGGNHRWSWFASDLSPDGQALMARFAITWWDDGYDVRFPDLKRHVPTPYRSLSSGDFATGLTRMLPEEAILITSRAPTIDAAGVTLDSGERVAARAVIDCRGFAPTPHLSGGWQAFLGRHLRTDKPHGVERPLIMDATVGQNDRFRFAYVLPLGEHELFVEDTYYQEAALLDRDAAERRLDRYTGRKRWSGRLLGTETGVLPVITGGDFDAWQQQGRIEGVGRAGAGAGFLHPLTSYTLPFAVETALAVAREADLPGPRLAAMLEDRARAHWESTRFYRRLGSMLFGAARSRRRWKLFARFYRLPVPVIERFYAARSTRADRWRIVCGKPPVSPLKALRALATSRPALEVAE
jgi:lycopene beta-cyclase